jgi:hypothetical protein
LFSCAWNPFVAPLDLTQGFSCGSFFNFSVSALQACSFVSFPDEIPELPVLEKDARRESIVGVGSQHLEVTTNLTV